MGELQARMLSELLKQTAELKMNLMMLVLASFTHCRVIYVKYPSLLLGILICSFTNPSLVMHVFVICVCVCVR